MSFKLTEQNASLQACTCALSTHIIITPKMKLLIIKKHLWGNPPEMFSENDTIFTLVLLFSQILQQRSSNADNIYQPALQICLWLFQYIES